MIVRGLTGDREVYAPGLPGSGAKVEFVPTKDDLQQMIESAGFQRIRLTKFGDPPCFVQAGVAMRETHFEGFKASFTG